MFTEGACVKRFKWHEGVGVKAIESCSLSLSSPRPLVSDWACKSVYINLSSSQVYEPPMVYVTYSVPDAGLLSLFSVRCSLTPDEMIFLPFSLTKPCFLFPFLRLLRCLCQSFASYL